ncbi:MAG: hypothetical protein ABI333_27535 [bacterium]
MTPNSNQNASVRLRIQLYRSIADVDGGWDHVVRGQSLFLQRPYLRAIETGDCEPLVLCYALFFDGERPVGAARFQVTEFVGEPIGPLLDRSRVAVAFLARKLRLVQRPFRVPVIVCGDAFHSGEHGFAFLPEVRLEDAVQSLADAAIVLQQELDAQGVGAAGILFKDFYDPSAALVEQLREYAFCDFETEPDMVLRLDGRWRTFDDYLDSLSSKYRNKARRAYAKSAGIHGRALTVDEVVIHEARLRELHDSVLRKAPYRLGTFGMRSLVNLHRSLGGEHLVRGYFRGDELVAFLSGFVVESSLEAHLVGLDYRFNQECALYSRMLYDYLQLALERGLSQVHYGRTAAEIKSTVGAVPVRMKCLLRHRQKGLNRLLPVLGRTLRVTDFPQRRPFKQAWYALQNPGSGSGLPQPV